MPVRIVDASAKAVYTLLGFALVLTASVATVIVSNYTMATLVGTALVAALIWVGGRTFRVPGEPIRAARAWWQMSGRPAAGFVGAGLFLLQAVATATANTGSATLTVIVVIVDLVIASAYLNSSIRLRAHRQTAEAERRAG